MLFENAFVIHIGGERYFAGCQSSSAKEQQIRSNEVLISDAESFLNIDILAVNWMTLYDWLDIPKETDTSARLDYAQIVKFSDMVVDFVIENGQNRYEAERFIL